MLPLVISTGSKAAQLTGELQSQGSSRPLLTSGDVTRQQVLKPWRPKAQQPLSTSVFRPASTIQPHPGNLLLPDLQHCPSDTGSAATAATYPNHLHPSPDLFPAALFDGPLRSTASMQIQPGQSFATIQPSISQRLPNWEQCDHRSQAVCPDEGSEGRLDTLEAALAG